MNLKEAFKSEYLRVQDLHGQPKTYTIRDVFVEAVGQEKEEKPVVQFKETPLKMVLNKTNAQLLIDLFGEDTERYVGQKILVTPARTEFGGKQVDCLRLAVPPVGKPVQEAPIEDIFA